MASMDDKEVVAVLLKNDGYYPGDPQVAEIWQYNCKTSGRTRCAVFYRPEENDLYKSPYVEDPVLLFDKELGVTLDGEQWLKDNDGSEV